MPLRKVYDMDAKPKGPCIHHRDMLQLLGAKNPDGSPAVIRDLTFRTHNRRTGRGGRLIVIPECVLLTEDALPNPRAIRRRSTRPKAPHKAGAHFRRATRNFLLPTGEVQKVIIWPIIGINGMEVILS
jgi:hypothetical protein